MSGALAVFPLPLLIAAAATGAAAAFLFWGSSLGGAWLLASPHGRRLLGLELVALAACLTSLAAAGFVLDGVSRAQTFGSVMPALVFLTAALTCQSALAWDFVEHGPGALREGMRRAALAGLGAVALTSWCFLVATVAALFHEAPSAQAVLRPYFIVLAGVWALGWTLQIARQTASR